MLVKIDAEKLKQLRESRCWSQQQLADMASLSLRTVQRIEAKAVSSQESIKCIAAVFDTPVHTLLNEPALSHDTAHEERTVPDTDRQSPGEPVIDHTQQESPSPQKALSKQEFFRLYASFAVVFVSHLFGFVGIFAAFDEARISLETFQLLKNSLSIVLILSAVVLFIKDRQLRKKLGIGSSFS